MYIFIIKIIYIKLYIFANTTAKSSPSYTSYRVTNAEMQPPNLTGKFGPEAPAAWDAM